MMRELFYLFCIVSVGFGCFDAPLRIVKKIFRRGSNDL